MVVGEIMAKRIRVAISGVGSCASALVQGIEYYIRNPNQKMGLSQPDIGGYIPADIQFVVGFDIDIRKVGFSLQEAIYASPNCNMQIIDPNSNFKCINNDSIVYRGPTLDGFPEYMSKLDQRVTFVEAKDTPEITDEEYCNILKQHKIDILINYMPVGSDLASKFYIENAIKSGVHVVNCMPSFISTEDAQHLESLAIENGVTIVGSDMRSAYGASRLSEVIQGSMLDSGLVVTQHIQMNMAAGATQGEEHIVNGVTANTDFLIMSKQDRLKNKHISKENVLTGQNKVRNKEESGTTMFAGPSLTVVQRPGGVYRGSDNKIANFDIIAFGWGGAKYELTARMSVQDSPNSGGVVADAIRYCKVAEELGIVGYLRGASAYTQKTPPVQLRTNDAKFECDALARRVITPMTEKQLKKNNPRIENLDYTFQKNKTEYE